MGDPEDEQGERREVQRVAGPADDGRQPEAPVCPTAEGETVVCKRYSERM